MWTRSALALLSKIDLQVDDEILKIFDAFFRPPLGPEGGGPVFARIFALLAVGDARDQALVQRLYDPSARLFIDALCQARPTVRREICAWGYSMALGLLTGAVGRSGRAERLAELPQDAANDTEALIARLTCYAAGGFAALSQEVGA
jgi:hypothetical protein